MWPEIWRLAEEKISQAHSDGHRVCVVDAAIMLNAGWQRHMHEVWVTIAPDTEVSEQLVVFYTSTCMYQYYLWHSLRVSCYIYRAFRPEL